ncbi:hypothetical protein QYE76_051204 [Lolium multiflorum]|uniref:Retrotransposon protein, putative, Ty1-copia subclass n=1 Tax=Lolium multiflorum TaxID=4521 RepID=A0AAD8SSY8_LOLMU|nr:hypothetical protein QYE76_051204 [Lolium multiflorum]
MIVDDNDEDPATYEEAMMSPDSNKWQEAMKSEMGSMYDNKVWTLVDLPDSRKAVENKWIFKRKTDVDDKTLLDTTCSGSFTSNKEEFKRDLLDRIKENAEDWENDKGKESGYADKPPFKPLPPKEGSKEKEKKKKKKGTKKKKKKKKENKEKEPWPQCQNAPAHHPSAAYTRHGRRSSDHTPHHARPKPHSMPLVSHECTRGHVLDTRRAATSSPPWTTWLRVEHLRDTATPPDTRQTTTRAHRRRRRKPWSAAGAADMETRRHNQAPSHSAVAARRTARNR